MISYAQNFEDVMLERLFGTKRKGFYIDVGAWDPDKYSVTRHFYRRGWRGLNIEPIARRHALFVEARPRDINLHSLVGGGGAATRFFECVEEDYLSTTVATIADALRECGHTLKEYDVQVNRLDALIERHCPKVIDFLKIDVEGAEAEILKTIDLSRHRPRALVIEATIPGSGLKSWDEPEANGSWEEWEGAILKADYAFALFDGLNRFYLRKEDAKLAPRLTLHPGIFDGIDCSQGPQNEAAERLDVIQRQQVEIEALEERCAAAEDMAARLEAERAASDGSAGGAELVTAVDALELRLDAVERERFALAVQLGASEAARGELVAEHASWAGEINALKDQLTASEQAGHEQVRHVADSQAACEALRAADFVRTEAMMMLRERLEATERAWAERNSAADRLSEDLQEAQLHHAARTEANHVEMETLRTGQAESDQLIAELRRGMVLLQEEQAELLASNRRLAENYTNEQNNALVSARAMAALQSGNDTLHALIDGLERQVAALRMQGDERAKAMEHLRREVDEARRIQAELVRSASVQREGFDAQREASGQAIEQLRIQIEAVSVESASRLVVIEKLDAALKIARDRIAQLIETHDARIAMLESDRAAREILIAETQEQVIALERHDANRLDLIQQLGTELESVRADSARTQREHNDQTLAIERDRQARGELIEQMREKLVTLEGSWNERGNLIDALSGHLTESRQATDDARAVAALGEAEIARALIECEKLRDEANEHARMGADRLDLVKTRDARIASLDQSLAKALVEIDQLKSRWLTRVKTSFTGRA